MYSGFMGRRTASRVGSVLLVGILHVMGLPCAGMAATVSAAHCDDRDHEAGALSAVCDHCDSPRLCAAPPGGEGVLGRASVSASLDFTLPRPAADTCPRVAPRPISRAPAPAFDTPPAPLRC